MVDDKYGRSDYWEERWAEALAQHGEKIARRPPNPHLVEALEAVPIGTALDAGCGHGSDALWLAARGWSVCGVDFSSMALERARRTAEDVGLGERVDWVQADLTSWSVPKDSFDLVISIYVHSSDGPDALIQRLSEGVRAGGSLFMVGHSAIDPMTSAPTRAAGQSQATVTAAQRVLKGWSFVVSEDRPRPTGGGADAVIHAVRVT